MGDPKQAREWVQIDGNERAKVALEALLRHGPKIEIVSAENCEAELRRHAHPCPNCGSALIVAMRINR